MGTTTTATTTMVPVLPDNNKKPAESKQTADKTSKISVKPLTTISGSESISVSGLLPSTEEDNPIKTVETLTNKINTESVEDSFSKNSVKPTTTSTAATVIA